MLKLTKLRMINTKTDTIAVQYVEFFIVQDTEKEVTFCKKEKDDDIIKGYFIDVPPLLTITGRIYAPVTDFVPSTSTITSTSTGITDVQVVQVRSNTNFVDNNGTKSNIINFNVDGFVLRVDSGASSSSSSSSSCSLKNCYYLSNGKNVVSIMLTNCL